MIYLGYQMLERRVVQFRQVATAPPAQAAPGSFMLPGPINPEDVILVERVTTSAMADTAVLQPRLFIEIMDNALDGLKQFGTFSVVKIPPGGLLFYNYAPPIPVLIPWGYMLYVLWSNLNPTRANGRLAEANCIIQYARCTTRTGPGE